MEFKKEIKKTEEKIQLLESSGKKDIEQLKKLDNQLKIMSNELVKQRIKLEVLKEYEK